MQWTAWDPAALQRGGGRVGDRGGRGVVTTPPGPFTSQLANLTSTLSLESARDVAVQAHDVLGGPLLGALGVALRQCVACLALRPADEMFNSVVFGGGTLCASCVRMCDACAQAVPFGSRHACDDDHAEGEGEEDDTAMPVAWARRAIAQYSDGSDAEAASSAAARPAWGGAGSGSGCGCHNEGDDSSAATGSDDDATDDDTASQRPASKPAAKRLRLWTADDRWEDAILPTAAATTTAFPHTATDTDAL